MAEDTSPKNFSLLDELTNGHRDDLFVNDLQQSHWLLRPSRDLNGS